MIYVFLNKPDFKEHLYLFSLNEPVFSTKIEAKSRIALILFKLI